MQDPFLLDTVEPLGDGGAGRAGRRDAATRFRVYDLADRLRHRQRVRAERVLIPNALASIDFAAPLTCNEATLRPLLEKDVETGRRLRRATDL